MEGMAVKECIEKLISEIGKYRREIESKGNARASAIKVYDMKLAIAIATLRDSENYELAGKTYKCPPATLTEKIAKGLVAAEKETMEKAESNYKACISNLNALLAQLNGYQSIFRHLESM